MSPQPPPRPAPVRAPPPAFEMSLSKRALIARSCDAKSSEIARSDGPNAGVFAVWEMTGSANGRETPPPSPGAKAVVVRPREPLEMSHTLRIARAHGAESAVERFSIDSRVRAPFASKSFPRKREGKVTGSGSGVRRTACAADRDPSRASQSSHARPKACTSAPTPPTPRTVRTCANGALPRGPPRPTSRIFCVAAKGWREYMLRGRAVAQERGVRTSTGAQLAAGIARSSSAKAAGVDCAERTGGGGERVRVEPREKMREKVGLEGECAAGPAPPTFPPLFFARERVRLT